MNGPILLNGRVTLRARFTGVERSATEIISRLVRSRPELYRMATPPSSSPGAGQVWEQLVLPMLAARLRSPLVYSPANLAPLAWPRNVLVLHDAAVWRAPDSYSAAYRAWHRRAEAAAARRAMTVITVSEFSRGELIEVLGLPPASVVVVPNGVSERFRPDADPEPVRRRHGLARPYVLTVGSGRVRKNLPLLDELAQRLGSDGVEVVWAGGPQAADNSSGRVRGLGYVEDADLPGLYVGAEVFVLPSSYEGFGIPCVEAMACGTPVVAADRSAVPETCGGAAVLVEAGDAGRFADAVIDLLGDPGRRQRLREDGLSRAGELTWDRAAAATDVILRGHAGRAG